MVNFPTVSRKDKKYARMDEKVYPPRIVLKISEAEQVLFRSSASQQLRVNVTGRDDQCSFCQGFSLPILNRVKRGMILMTLYQLNMGGYSTSL